MIFGSSFFQGCWDIISVDVCATVKQFFIQNWILPGTNSNIVFLIPKIQGAVSIKVFKPIVVANFRFKVISKILTERLAGVCSRIISHYQNDFIKGWNIKE